MRRIAILTGAVAVAVIGADGCQPPRSIPVPTPARPKTGFKLTVYSQSAGSVTLAYVVKSTREPWFKRELTEAEMAAKKDNFTLLEYSASTTSQLNKVIQDAARRGAKGLIVCAPMVRDGSEILAAASAAHMKVMSVDDQLVDHSDKPIDAPFIGVNPAQVGRIAADAMVDEMKRRNWLPDFTRALIFTKDSNPSLKGRTDAIRAELIARGFPAASLTVKSLSGIDIRQGEKAALGILGHQRDVGSWLISGATDSVVMGAGRATEDLGMAAERVIAVGINGDRAPYEFRKPRLTAFYGSVLLSASMHGEKSSRGMFDWVTKGVVPPAVTYSKGILITRDNFRRYMHDRELTL